MKKLVNLLFSVALSVTAVFLIARALDQAINVAFIKPPEYGPTWLQWETGAIFLGFVIGSISLSRFIYRRLSK